uniref:Uncharacterized protein n=1 Tax=Lotharella globosa TaxID=91324 RepID=A0A7S4DX50_9EUKA
MSSTTPLIRTRDLCGDSSVQQRTHRFGRRPAHNRGYSYEHELSRSRGGMLSVGAARMPPRPPAPTPNGGGKDAEAGLTAMQQSLQKLNPEIVNDGGLVIQSQPENGKEMLRGLLEETYLGIEFERFPSMRLMNVEPPIIRIPGFFSKMEMAALEMAAKDTQKVEDSDSHSVSSVSTDVLYPVLNKLKTLFPFTQKWSPWEESQPKDMEALAFEDAHIVSISESSSLPQEDALPLNTAFDQRYQRRMKVRGILGGEGEITFNNIQLSFPTEKGDLIAFYPAYKNSLPDMRIKYTDSPSLSTSSSSPLTMFETWITARLERMSEIQKNSGSHVSHPKMAQFARADREQNREQKKLEKAKEKRPTNKALKKSKSAKKTGGFGS